MDPPASPTSAALVASSPRRTLNLPRSRHRSQSSPSPSSASGNMVQQNLSPFTSGGGEHSPKLLEVYGFVGSITVVITTVIFLVWAYIPEPWLHNLGITYYPSKHWALVVPSFIMVAIALGLCFYVGLNFMVTPPPTSFITIFDEYSREPAVFVSSSEIEKPIEPISDISVDRINRYMFGDYIDGE